MSMTERAFREYEDREPYDNECSECERLQKKVDSLEEDLRDREDDLKDQDIYILKLQELLTKHNICFQTED